MSAARDFLGRIYREVDAHASKEDHAEQPARRALLAGVFSSAAMLAGGLLVVWLRHESRPNEPPALSEVIHGIGQGRGTCLLYAGLLLLAATPILRVMVMTGVYVRRRELFMAIVSAIVLGLLAFGVLMGSG
jgi:uncharacterized membrane protein